jgi:STAS-like domain of unknown function (DUF4325)
MPLIRATAKLLKRLHLPTKPPEPESEHAASLGEWYADIDFIDREPFVVMLNAATGVGLALPGRAAALRKLHTYARDQLVLLFAHYGIGGALADAELQAWTAPPHYAATRDRSLLGSLRRFKDDSWHRFAHVDRNMPMAAADQWHGLFRHPDFIKARERYGDQHWQRPLDLIRERLQSTAPAPSPEPGTTLRLRLIDCAAGETPMSRSAAQRWLRDAVGVRTLLLDCSGVEAVGQAFADEVFRVFANAHPETTLMVVNAEPEVLRMIRRAEALREQQRHSPSDLNWL